MRRAFSKRRVLLGRRADALPIPPTRRKRSENTGKRAGLHEKPAQVPICATLSGSNRCEALGITKRGSAPLLALRRALMAAGHDPSRPLHAYRDDVLALWVRSIGDGARLRLASHGVGFERLPECTGGSRVRQNGQGVLGTVQRGSSTKTYPPGKGPSR
jgi:hypothetical protein